MTFLEFTGCSMIAFGPVLSMFVTTISNDPIRVILLILAAFFWLVSLLLSSFTWFFISFAGNYLILGVACSNLIQEAFRYLLYKFIRHTEQSINKVSEIGNANAISTNRTVLAYVCGLGFGVMSGAFSLLNILADSLGPGTLGIHGDSNYFFISSSFSTLAFILLHVFWSVILFKGCDQKNYFLISYVVVTHLIASQITLLNQNYSFLVSIGLIYVLTSFTALLTLRLCGLSINNIKAAWNR